MKDQASFRVKYNFAGPQYQQYHNVYQLQHEKFSLPKTWSVEPGTTNIGHDHCQGEWIFHGLSSSFVFLLNRQYFIILGDHKHLNEAKKNAQDFYKDLSVTIEDIHHQ
jgi:hypothetical protein